MRTAIKSTITYTDAVERIARQEIEELKVIRSFSDLDAAIGKANAKDLQQDVRNAFEAEATQRIKAVAGLFSMPVEELTSDVRRKRREMTGEVEREG